METEQLGDAGHFGVDAAHTMVSPPFRVRDTGTGADVPFINPIFDAPVRPRDTGVVGLVDAHDTGFPYRDTGTGVHDAGEPGEDAREPGEDAGEDSGHPVEEDSGEDSGEDAGFDAGHDAGFDAGVDSGEDSGEDAGVFDAGIDQSVPDGGWVIAPHYPMPQVVDYGAQVNATPVFTAVTFPTYDLTSEAENFVATVGSTPYWTSAVSEYGVGPAAVATPVELTESAPTSIDDSAIQTWLAGKLDGSPANAAFGTPTESSVYFIAYPLGTTVTLDSYTSCVEGGFGGYHNSVQLTSGPWAGLGVSYAVLPECDIEASYPASLTQSGSHELIEATTDPLPQTETPAYLTVDQADFAWELVVGGGEVADMCAQVADAFFQPAGYAYSVQRAWSNAAAAAGHDPCQPSPWGSTSSTRPPS